MASPLGGTPFASKGLDSLLAGAARDCPHAVLMRDDRGASTALQLMERVRKLVVHLRLLDFAPGERVLVVADARTDTLVAVAALLRAGLVPALVPCHLNPVEMAAHARVAEAVALIGPDVCGGLHLGETYLSAAAIVETIRMIACQGPGLVDAAIDVAFPTLDAMGDPGEQPLPPRDVPPIATFAGPRTAPTMRRHRQAALFADALSLVEQARINPSKPLISTVSPATLAGLVAGPFAALIGASSLVLHGPFDAGRFLALCDAEPGYHLVVPGALGPLFADRALSADLASLILVTRYDDPEAFAVPASNTCERPVVDVYAFGEDQVLAQRRTDGEARSPARVGSPGAGSPDAASDTPRSAEQPVEHASGVDRASRPWRHRTGGGALAGPWPGRSPQSCPRGAAPPRNGGSLTHARHPRPFRHRRPERRAAHAGPGQQGLLVVVAAAVAPDARQRHRLR